jgi:hypothetical protein
MKKMFCIVILIIVSNLASSANLIGDYNNDGLIDLPSVQEDQQIRRLKDVEYQLRQQADQAMYHGRYQYNDPGSYIRLQEQADQVRKTYRQIQYGY